MLGAPIDCGEAATAEDCSEKSATRTSAMTRRMQDNLCKAMR